MANTPLKTANNITSARFTETITPSTPPSGKGNFFFTTLGAFWIKNTGAIIPIQTFKREIFVQAYEMWPSTTAGSSAITKTESATNKQNTQSLDFDQTTQEHAEFTLWMPDDWNFGTITYKIIWTAAAGSAAQTVKWDLQARAYADDDAIDQAWGTVIEVSDALITTGDIHITAESAALTIAGTPSVSRNFIQFRVFRDINDTLLADAKLLGIKIYYT